MRYSTIPSILILVGCAGGGSVGESSARDPSVPPPASPDAGSTVPPPPPDTCEVQAFEATADGPTVMVVLDRSASMGTVHSGDGSRWAPAVRAIESAVDALEDRIAFGLMYFPIDSYCGPGRMAVEPALGNGDEIRCALSGGSEDEWPGAGEDGTDPMGDRTSSSCSGLEYRPVPSPGSSGGTPIAATLEGVARELAAMGVGPGGEGGLIGADGSEDPASTQPTYVLLVTDGAPNCNESLDAATCVCTHYDERNCGGTTSAHAANCLDDTDTLAAIDALRAVGGVKTYVLGYDTPEWSSLLDRMARRGGTGAYHPVGDEASLHAALGSIGGSIVSCRYDLAEAPDDIRFVRVLVDGEPVDHVSVSPSGAGWQLDGDRTIELVGAPCDSLRDGATHEIAIERECHALF